MKTKLALIIVITFSLLCFNISTAQKNEKVNNNPAFEKFWKEFIQAIEKKDNTTLNNVIIESGDKDYIISNLNTSALKKLKVLKTSSFKKIAKNDENFNGNILDNMGYQDENKNAVKEIKNATTIYLATLQPNDSEDYLFILIEKAGVWKIILFKAAF